MSLKEKIQKLFKKKIIEVNKTSQLTGLYTAKSSDVKQLTNQVNHIQDTLDNLQIPVLPDHSDFAQKSQDNTFTASNTFTKAVKLETFPEISRGNFEPSLNKQLTPKYYVDKKVNDNIAGIDTKLTMNVNTLNQNITTASEGALRDAKTYADEKLQESKNFTQQEIAKIPSVDLSKVAKLDQINTFNNENYFNRVVQFNNSGTSFLNYPSVLDQTDPIYDANLVNKKYVDKKIPTKPIIDGYVYVLQSSELGFYTSGSIRCYYMRLTQRNVAFNNSNIKDGKYYDVFCTIRVEGNSSESWKQTNISRCYRNVRASGRTITLPIINPPEPNITFVWPTDWGNPFKLVWDCLILEQ